MLPCHSILPVIIRRMRERPVWTRLNWTLSIITTGARVSTVQALWVVRVQLIRVQTEVRRMTWIWIWTLILYRGFSLIQYHGTISLGNSAVIDVFPNDVPRISLALGERLKSEKKHANDNCLMNNIASKKPLNSWDSNKPVSPTGSSNYISRKR